jgi:signal peptidase I
VNSSMDNIGQQFSAPMDSPETIQALGRKSLSRALAQEFFQIILPAILLATGLHTFVAQATVVHGESMEPNLYPQQRLIIDKISYHLHPPRRNDIVVLDSPESDLLLIKRVVGLPGETVEVRGGLVYVDGQLLDESFANSRSDEMVPPVVVPPLSYYLMGDNRNNSNDSRAFGPIRRSEIVGRAWIRYWPITQFSGF